MRLSEFDFDLPNELIAQAPVRPRDAARLMVLRGSGLENRVFTDLLEYLEEGDVLVVNDSKVIPARIHGRKKTGGRIELLLVNEMDGGMWECLVKGRVREGTEIEFGTASAIVYEKRDGRCVVAFDVDDFDMFLKVEGEMPLPPYIKSKVDDPDDYQTTYAEKDGSVAAPTAGLHFTEELLRSIQNKGINIVPITLHVSPGTFLPIKADLVEDHQMEEEYVHVPEESAEAVLGAKREGKRVFAVGTTSLKAMEAASTNGQIGSFEDWSELFIYPRFEFKSGVDALVTNFHLPKSTLFLLASAFLDRDRLLEAYAKAIELKYRFYSFGDAMLIFR